MPARSSWLTYVGIVSGLLLLALTPERTDALQLRWISGTTDLSFAESRACTLVVRFDPGTSLPKV